MQQINDLFGVVGEMTGIGWHLPEDLTADEWRKAGASLAKVEQSKQWWLGDWWNAGNTYGDRKAACEDIGVEYQTAANAGSVSKRFENFSRRREKLTFRHHTEVCVIDDPTVQDRMLDWCEEPLIDNPDGKPRSTSELREQVRAYLDDQSWTPDERKRRAIVQSGRSIAVNLKADERLIRWAQFEGVLVKIDRTSDWGNPFVMPEDGGRDHCCDAFATYLSLKAGLLKRLPELKGKVLACWCHPQRCHGHHLATLANQSNDVEEVA